ncbi:helix-turn-helix domain-containing protein [Streptomyces hydrogenans]
MIALSRKARGVTQESLGGALGLSQAAISRLERTGTRAYSTDDLRAAAAHLRIPPELVGLADRSKHPQGKDESDVDRRRFLGGAAGVAAAPLVARAPASTEPATGQAAALRLSTTALRRLDQSTPSRDLKEPITAHVGLIQAIASASSSQADRARLAAVGSEAASFAGWLSWDMGDLGSARVWYGSAIKAAHVANHPLLAAYQIGTLASFEAHVGNVSQALAQAQQARKALEGERPEIAEAWLCSVEALAFAAGGDSKRADQALVASRRAAEAVTDEPPPWPWVSAFSPEKVAASRVRCGATLGLTDWVLIDHEKALATGHAKQRALLLLDIASGHLAAGRIDMAFAKAREALETGTQYRSGRIVEAARTLRGKLPTSRPPRTVQEFDEQIRDVYL